MKQPRVQFSTASMLLGIFLIAYILAAHSRGNYLFGPRAGITYAVIAMLISTLLVRAWMQTPLPRIRLGFLVLFVVAVSLAFSFPTYLNPNVQYVVNKQATDRHARAELAAVFASDPAFGDLGVSTRHLKIVNVEIHGSVPTKADLDRLRSLVLNDCQFVDLCFVHWQVYVRRESSTYTALDDEVWHVASGR